MATLGSCCTRRYAAQSSDCTIEPGAVWACMMGSNVAASRRCTTSIYPSAGWLEVSTMPNTHTSKQPGCAHLTQPLVDVNSTVSVYLSLVHAVSYRILLCLPVNDEHPLIERQARLGEKTQVSNGLCCFARWAKPADSI